MIALRSCGVINSMSNVVWSRGLSPDGAKERTGVVQLRSWIVEACHSALHDAISSFPRAFAPRAPPSGEGPSLADARAAIVLDIQ